MWYPEDDRLYLDVLRISVGDSPQLTDKERTLRTLPPMDPRALEHTEWCREFEVLMRNRLIMGGMRYGRIGDPTKPKYDRARSILNRILRYEEGGNKEHLVDVANEAMLEYREPSHPKAHWEAEEGGYQTEQRK